MIRIDRLNHGISSTLKYFNRGFQHLYMKYEKGRRRIMIEKRIREQYKNKKNVKKRLREKKNRDN